MKYSSNVINIDDAGQTVAIIDGDKISKQDLAFSKFCLEISGQPASNTDAIKNIRKELAIEKELIRRGISLGKAVLEKEVRKRVTDEYNGAIYDDYGKNFLASAKLTEEEYFEFAFKVDYSIKLYDLIGDAVIPDLVSGTYQTNDAKLLEAMKKDKELGEKAASTMSEADMVNYANYTDELMNAYYNTLIGNTKLEVTQEGAKLGIDTSIINKEK